jgi:hypothetical protein
MELFPDNLRYSHETLGPVFLVKGFGQRIHAVPSAYARDTLAIRMGIPRVLMGISGFDGY